MIRPLRRRHRLVFAVLAVALPLLLAAGLLARRAPVRVERIPATLVDGPEAVGSPVWETVSSWGGSPVSARLFPPAGGESRPVLEVVPADDLRSPDVLVLWRRDAAGEEEEPYLLGSLAGVRPRRFRLPELAATRSGRVVLLSLARNEVLLDAALPPSANEVSP